MTLDSLRPEDKLTQHSVTLLLQKARSQDAAAIAELWHKYWNQLVMAAHRQCRYQTALVDPEFIAQSVFAHVCNKFRTGSMDAIDDREQFWAVLLNLTKNRAIDHFRRETRQKRGGGVTVTSASNPDDAGGDNLFADRQTLDDQKASELLDHFKHILDAEDSTGTLTQVLLGKIAGESNQAIATALQVSARTIDRKVERIRLTLELSHS